MGFQQSSAVIYKNRKRRFIVGNPSDITIREASNSTRNFVYRQPMKFGGRVVEDVCVLCAPEVLVTREGTKKKHKGIGEMTMGNAWAWPSRIPGKITLRLMLELANRLVAKVRMRGSRGIRCKSAAGSPS